MHYTFRPTCRDSFRFHLKTLSYTELFSWVHIIIVWGMPPCCLLREYRPFGGKTSLHFHFYADALCSSETLIPTYQTKPYHKPQVRSSGSIKPHKLSCAWLTIIQRKCYTMFHSRGLLKVYDCRMCNAIVYHFLFQHVTSAVYSSLPVTSKSKIWFTLIYSIYGIKLQIKALDIIWYSLDTVLSRVS
jgi:hypothetical protein